MVSNYACLSHYLGPQVADSLLIVDPHSKATDAVPSHVANANPSVFHRPDGQDRQVIEVIEVLQHRAVGESLH